MAVDNQLAGFEIHGFRTFQELDIGNIVKDTRGRWLSNEEIHAILFNHKHFCVYRNPVNLPKSGALLLFDRKRFRNFRKDGHNWHKKKDGKKVDEYHARVKVGNEERIHVCYVRGQDNPSFARRCYWLLDKNLEHIVLVHYREPEMESGNNHVYFAGDKDFLESTKLGGNLTFQNHESILHDIIAKELEELLLTNDSNNSTAPKEDEFSRFDQSNQNVVNDFLYDKKRQREDAKAQPEGSGSEDMHSILYMIRNMFFKVMEMQPAQNFWDPTVETAIRKIVKDEVKIFQRELLNSREQKRVKLGNCGNEASISESRSLQVNSIDNLSPLVFSEAGIGGEDCFNIQVPLVGGHIEQPQSYDTALLAGGSSHMANVHFPASLPRTESPNGSKFLCTSKIGEFDYSQPCAPSPMSLRVPSGLDESCLPNSDSMCPRFNQPFSCLTDPCLFNGEDFQQNLDATAGHRSFPQPKTERQRD